MRRVLSCFSHISIFFSSLVISLQLRKITEYRRENLQKQERHDELVKTRSSTRPEQCRAVRYQRSCDSHGWHHGECVTVCVVAVGRHGTTVSELGHLSITKQKLYSQLQ